MNALNLDQIESLRINPEREKLIQKIMEQAQIEYELKVCPLRVKKLLEIMNNGASAIIIRIHLIAIFLTAGGEKHQKLNAAMSTTLHIVMEMVSRKICNGQEQMIKTLTYANRCMGSLDALEVTLTENIRPSGIVCPGGRERIKNQLRKVDQQISQTNASMSSWEHQSAVNQDASSSTVPFYEKEQQKELNSLVGRLFADFLSEFTALTEQSQSDIVYRLLDRAGTVSDNMEKTRVLLVERYKNRFKRCKVQANDIYRHI